MNHSFSATTMIRIVPYEPFILFDHRHQATILSSKALHLLAVTLCLLRTVIHGLVKVVLWVSDTLVVYVCQPANL
jgi:hypothetical protein